MLYFTLAARNFARVHVHGVVGDDAVSEFSDLLAHPNVETAGVQTNSRPTRTWRARHDFERWIAVVDGDSGGFESDWDDDWDRRLTPAAAAAPALFVGSMAPAYQIDIIDQSQARLIGCDTMNNFIVNEHQQVIEVVSRSDILFANHEELSLLCGTEIGGWREAAQGLLAEVPRLRAVVVKAGPLGAALVTKNAIAKREAVQISEVIDPTGAGDSLAGGFLGYCAQHEGDGDDALLDALDSGLRRAALAIGSFGTAGLAGAAVV